MAQLDQRNALGVKIVNGIDEVGSSMSGTPEDPGSHVSTQSERDGVSEQYKDSPPHQLRHLGGQQTE